MRITDTHIYFWGSFLSNFIPNDLNIVYNNLNFTNSEQLFMWHKSQYFRDFETGTRIVNEGKNPKTAKRLGREVRNYNDEKWSKVREHYMYLSVKAKFDSSKDLQNKLLATENRILVEASPVDRIWGVGIHYDDDLILNESNWEGKNLLGKVLMKVREEYKN